MNLSAESLAVILLLGITAGWRAGQLVRGTGFDFVGDRCRRRSHRHLAVSPARFRHRSRNHIGNDRRCRSTAHREDRSRTLVAGSHPYA